MSDLIIRDCDTGESKVFTPTRDGYAEAEAFKKAIEQQGHRVGDDNSGTLGRIKSLFGD